MKRFFSIKFEIITMIILCIVLFSAVISAVSYRIFSDIMKKQMETLIEDTCIIAKDCVSGDKFEEYLESKGKSDASLRALKLLQIICDDTKFNYLYVIRPDFEKGKVLNSLSVHGSMYPKLEVYEVGEITEITAVDYYEAYSQVMKGEKASAFVYRLDMPYSDRYMHHITGLVPICDSNKNIVGIMCAEATFSWYKETLRFYLKNFFVWMVIIIFAVIIITSLLLHLRVIIPFIKITKETKRFAIMNKQRGKSLYGEVKRRNELGQLAKSIDLMEHQLLKYVDNITKMTAEKEKSETQLKIATAIQLGALPKPITSEKVDLHATIKPALEVGGDFYDFFMIDENNLALVVADVSGKGVPAALFMMVSKLILRKNLKAGMSPAAAFTATNAELCEDNPADMFVTCLCCVLNLETKVLTVSNAGHEKPVLARNGKNFEFLKIKPGLVLGGMPGMSYKEEEIQLEAGDVLFSYTDGIPEAMNPENKEFGDSRLVEVLNSNKDRSLAELCDEVNVSVKAFNDTAPQFDDITMLVIKVKQ